MTGFFFYKKMSDENKLIIFEHLDELRKRLIISFVTVCIAFLVCFYYSDHLLYLLKLPLDHQLNITHTAPFFKLVRAVTEIDLYFIAPAEAFWAHLKISMIFSVLISFPVIITETWLFIKPALFNEERRLIVPLILFSILLFITGLLFCFLIVLPFAMEFLLNYKTESLVPMLTLEHYIDFTLKFILAFGVIFQLPVILVLLTKLNIITPDMLKRNRKYAVLIVFIVAAILTPTPDIFNQCLMAVPLMLLYEVSILIAGFIFKPKEGKVGD
jgi:sec-independent protein translocase protein TatC